MIKALRIINPVGQKMKMFSLSKARDIGSSPHLSKELTRKEAIQLVAAHADTWKLPGSYSLQGLEARDRRRFLSGGDSKIYVFLLVSPEKQATTCTWVGQVCKWLATRVITHK